MKILFILILGFLLMSISSAKEESLNMGPYKVSFDLDTTDELRVKDTIPAKYGETYGGIKYVTYEGHIDSNISVGNIEITCFDSNEIDTSLDALESSVDDFFENTEYYDVDTYTRIIDDNLGILGVGENFQNDVFFYAKYWQYNNTAIEIKSEFPWDDGTLSLLKTIRVELIGKPPTFKKTSC